MSKTQIIKLRVTPEEKRAAETVAYARGVSVSEIIRRSLARMIARAKRKGDA